LNQIDIQGLRTIQKEDLKRETDQVLGQSYFGLYHKDNFLFYPEGEIKKRILEKFKKISEIKISYQGFLSDDIKLVIKEKEAAFLYCRHSDQKCFFMEKNGQIFSEYKEAEVNKSRKEFLVFTDLKSETIPNFFLEEKDFTKLRSFLLDFEREDLKIVRVFRTGDDEYLLETKSGAVLIVLSNQDFNKIIEVFRKINIKDDLKIDRKKKDFKKAVAYINFSFGDTVFYCMHGDQCQNNYNLKNK
jgi:hypothetical protein